MIRDPFYLQIIERLGRKLDPEIFEACAADLLRDVYPGLVPMRGGQDAGMDGAIADGTGEAYPFVTTTQENVIGNLTKNLRSYKTSGRRRRKVVLATPQDLTPRKTQNLYDKADKFGFTLVQVHAQDDIANRLYHHPEWCLELLNLTGKPSALSIFPKTERPLVNKNLIGRDGDIGWLNKTKGDRLIVGQPGSGKTYLLHQYAMEGGGLFVVDDDRGEIAAGIRSQQPSAIIVDDAQIYLSLVINLKQMREELGAEFSILASCWRGDQDKVTQVMNLHGPCIHELDLLTRDQIVEVVNDAGIVGPTKLVREIVNQAEGRPGLAATLTHLCIHGGVREVFLGNALSGSVKKFFEPSIGSKAVDVLAAFSIGGNVGMAMQIVADGLQMKIVEIREITVELAAGGIIWETGTDKLSVHPPTLRHALIRDVFYKGALSLPIQHFIEKSPDLAQTVHTLLGAYARGARIPDKYLKDLIIQVYSVDVLENYAWQGSEEAIWVLDNYPELTVSIANSALEHIPGIVIPRLLKAAVGDNRPLHATTKHPLRLIDDWVRAGHRGSGEALNRRRALFESAKNWLVECGDAGVGLRALQTAFSPIYGDMITEPGAGNKVTIYRGYILLDEMVSLQKYWPEVLNIIKGIERIEWEPLRQIAQMWAFPNIMDVEISDEMREVMRSFAIQVLRDIVQLAKGHPGILHWANQTAFDAGLNINIPTDQEFETLYPTENRINWREAEAKNRPKVRNLAKLWSKKSPQKIAQKIARIEKEAQLADVKWPRWTQYLCFEIANIVESPCLWARAMIERQCISKLIEPFLRKSAEINESEWKTLALECLTQPNLKAVTISIVLTIDSPPEDLLERVLQNLTDLEQMIETLCLRGEIHEQIIRRLMHHEDPKIASAAAQGEWLAKPKEKVREALLPAWRSAMIRSRDDYIVSLVLQNNPDLSYDWLNALLADESIDLYDFRRSTRVAAGALDFEAKLYFLENIPANYSYGDIVQTLIRDDLDLYRKLLKNQRLKLLHLAPLTWHQVETWIEKAKLATDEGYSPQEITSAAYGFPFRGISFGGKVSNARKEWVERFSSLCSHEDERIQRIGTIGKANAEVAFQEALHREHDEKVYGFQTTRHRY